MSSKVTMQDVESSVVMKSLDFLKEDMPEFMTMFSIVIARHSKFDARVSLLLALYLCAYEVEALSLGLDESAKQPKLPMHYPPEVWVQMQLVATELVKQMTKHGLVKEQ